MDILLVFKCTSQALRTANARKAIFLYTLVIWYFEVYTVTIPKKSIIKSLTFQNPIETLQQAPILSQICLNSSHTN